MMPLEERFWQKVDTSGSCWVWTGAKQTSGYGNFIIAGKTHKPHRVAYELLVAPIPAGLQIDHLCRNRACVNPEHLEPVTQKENNRRRCELITHCPAGHAYAGDNLRVTPRGRRICLTCRRKRDNERLSGWTRQRIAAAKKAAA